MKKIIYLLTLVVLVITSCEKDDSNESPNCTKNFNLLVDKLWIPEEEFDDFAADVLFDSNGDFYEDGEYNSEWELSEDCNSINFVVTTNGNLEFTNQIVSISENTLVVKVTLFGDVTYHH